jgi:sigma-B regulation protein RsbU (phosphoserine phosphatase)
MMTEAVVVDVSQDWALACDVQQRFMQHACSAIDTLSYSARCRQIRALGGDCYDFSPLSHHRLGLAIGDASGKSLAAAIMIASVQSSLRTAAWFAENDVAGVLCAVNSHIYASSLSGQYATLFYGVFDGITRTLRYVNAGHNPPIVIRNDRSVIQLDTGGIPVGIFPNPAYEEGVVQLRPGDLIIGYTDGVTEVVNPAGQEWGIEGLRRPAAQNRLQSPDEIADAIFKSMDEFSRGRQNDDATILVAQVH